MAKTGSDEYKAKRLERDFTKKESETKETALFKSLAPNTQALLLKEASLVGSEIPVLACFRDEKTWLLATTRRVLWSRPGFKKELRYSEIKKLGWSSGPKAPRETPETIDLWMETEQGLKETKTATPWLFFVDESGNRYEAMVEHGRHF